MPIYIEQENKMKVYAANGVALAEPNMKGKENEKENNMKVSIKERSWEERIITPLNGIPPLLQTAPRKEQSLRPYDECDEPDELQFYLEM